MACIRSSKLKHALGIALLSATLAAQAGGIAEAYAKKGLAGLKIGSDWTKFSSGEGIKPGKCQAVELPGRHGPLVDQSCTFTFTTARELEGKPLASEGAAMLLGGKVVAFDVSVKLRAQDPAEAGEFLEKLAT